MATNSGKKNPTFFWQIRNIKVQKNSELLKYTSLLLVKLWKTKNMQATRRSNFPEYQALNDMQSVRVSLYSPLFRNYKEYALL